MIDYCTQIDKQYGLAYFHIKLYQGITLSIWRHTFVKMRLEVALFK